jgi:AraC family transcriptional regulator
VDHCSSKPHNLGAARIRSHCLSGIEVHCVQQDALPGRAWHQLSGNQPILSVVVNEFGGRCEGRLSINDGPARSNLERRRRIGHTSLIPSGLPVWGYSDHIARVDSVRLVLNVDSVLELMGGEFPVEELSELHLMFFDENLQALARLLALNQDTMPGFSLFGDGVVAAMIARLSRLNMTNRPSHRRLGLTKRQMTQVTELMRDNLAKPIRLSQLASVAGLSPSQFSRAFKVSTGTTPHKWLLDARIEYAKRMLADRSNSLVDIALDAGFSEQSHFTRAFGAATGISPNAWRHSQLAGSHN